MVQNGVCCFTGHRDYEKTVTPLEKLFFEKLIDNLIGYGYTTFIAGGALGFDTAAAEYVLKKKAQGLPVRLELILPCADQTNGWTERNKDIYNYIRAKADSVEYVTKTYTPTCMHERNRRLVEGSDFCIAYLTSPRGGTAYTYKYAKSRGVDVINLAEQK